MISAPASDQAKPITGPALRDDLVTVIVPCRNEQASIRGCLDSIRGQDEPNLQIIVVDGSSTDATRDLVAEIIAEDQRVELLDNAEEIVPTALNIALAAARGAWLVRVDAHATVPSDYVRRAVEHLRTGTWGAVGGRKDGVGRTAEGRAVAAAMSSKFGVGGSVYHYATQPMEVEHVPFGAYPTQLARDLGGWDTSLAVNQDFEFDRRVAESGHKLLLDPSLRIDWECRQTVSALAKQYRRYGSGKIDVMRKHPRSVSPRHLAPPALVVLLATSVVLAPRNPKLAAVAAAPYAAFLAAGTRDVRASLGEDPARRHAAPALAAMHLGWGVGALEGIIRHLRAAVTGDDPSTAAARRRERARRG